MPGISEKYFKYRGSSEKLRIDQDLYCAQCGYNVRGLLLGRNCPECGTMIEAPPPGSGGDPLLSGSSEDRRRWRLGLALATICAAQLLAVRVVGFAGLVLTGSRFIVTMMLISAAATSALWIASGWLLTPAALDGRWPQTRPMRLAARYLQWAWPIGYGALAARVVLGPAAGSEAFFNGVSLGMRGLGGLGVILLLMLLQRAARDAELEDVDARLGSVLWLLPLVTTALVLVPPSMTWIAAILILLLLVVPWAWLMLRLTLALLGLYQHVAWGLRHAASRHERGQRIAERQRELDQIAQSSIRAVAGGRKTSPADHRSRDS